MAHFAGTIISEGTLNPRHLIPRFLAVARRRAEEAKAGDIEAEVSEIHRRIEGLDEGAEYWDSEGAGWDLERLFDLLNELAPEGYYFGSLEGDGACFGFWPIDDDDTD